MYYMCVCVCVYAIGMFSYIIKCWLNLDLRNDGPLYMENDAQHN